MRLPVFEIFKKNVKDRTRGSRSVSVKLHSPDRWLLGALILICLFGVFMVYDSSVAIAIRDFSDRYHFAREQLQWLGLAFVGFAIASLVDYRLWYKLALPFLLGSLVLLIAVFIPGLGVRALGAHRWISVGGLVFQPSELTKLTMIIYLSAWFSTREKGRIGAFLLLLGMVVGLVVLEPDLGTATIILATAVLLYFYSGAPLMQFILLVPMLAIGVIGLALISPYRFQRLMTFFNPQSDPLGSSYHIRQALLALGSGGLWGLGIGKSRQKYEYLPEANTDSIFAIIGEEFGFLGAVLVVLLFVFIIWRCFRIARRAPDTFGRLMGAGIATWIGIQAVINFSAMTALLPLTGVPLPFISYGGSSLVITLIAMGIVVNISKHR
ncbi:putative lipid II flippase FtsW [Patescibacteria group bacterium]|nr:putative lipid II flippase FtsW [Patescibacteria group bacterium]MBU1472800.1 putative lipid II flippase FtsW [Patescibacteria group bacterium]MBU2459725.1 putative lipid II flippase FtsW [Patescibacteria group bacterium]